MLSKNSQPQNGIHTTWLHLYKILKNADVPGRTVDKNSVSAGDTSSTPGPGRFHMLQSNYTREPQLLSQGA